MPLLALLLASYGTLAGCATSQAKPSVCAGWKAIYPSKQDVLTDGTAKQILAHDEHGKAMGCWEKPTRQSVGA